MDTWLEFGERVGTTTLVLVAVGFVAYKWGNMVVTKFVGDQKANPPVRGWIDEVLDEFKRHNEQQAETLNAVAQKLATHDGHAQHRTEAIDTLVAQHTDPTIEGSTAQAIKHVSQIRQAAISSLSAWAECVEDDALRQKVEEIRTHFTD